MPYKDFNPDAIRSMDVGFIVTKNLFDMGAVAIRTASWKNPWQAVFHAYDYKMSNHSFYIVKDTDNHLWAYDASPKGFDINSLREYIGGSETIILIKRLPCFDGAQNRLSAVDILEDWAYQREKYPTMWQMFLDFTVERQKKHVLGLGGGIYCSESVEFLAQQFKGSFANFGDKPITPYDEQISAYGTVVNNWSK